MSHEVLKTKSESYRVAINGGTTLGAKGYSKYYERCSMAVNGKLNEPVYGLPQAIEHANEYRTKSDRYTEERQKASIQIIKVVTTEEVIETIQ